MYANRSVFTAHTPEVLSLSYFSPDDDLTPTISALKGDCHGLHFDDIRMSYDAESIAAGLTQQGYAEELLSFDHGGHSFDLFADQADEITRRLKAYFDPC